MAEIVLYGPNTNLGHGSITRMLEHQVGYTVRAVRVLEQRSARALVPKAAAQGSYNEQLQQDLAKRSWADPRCNSWYKNADGLITQNWSDTVAAFGERTARVELDDYELIV